VVAILAATAGFGIGTWSASNAPAEPSSTAAPPGEVAAQVPECSASAQPLIDAAAPGAVVVLPACIHRETLTIDRPLTLVGAPGAEIRGSDVWQDWAARDALYVSSRTVPTFPSHGHCRGGTDACLRPEQVFVDGSPLTEVAPGTTPKEGQFGLDAERHVLLAKDPAGHTVEVTTRTRWIVTDADGIVIEGIRMRHAANDAQEGAITDEGHEVTIRNCVMSDTHGAVVSLTGKGGLIGNDIFRGGQLGVHIGGALIADNWIHDNNTLGFDPAWEAGGVKSVAGGQVVVGNDVYDNAGPGLWWDVRAAHVRILDNRVHGNASAGILFEIGTGGRISGNRVWANGSRASTWGWGAGILISSSASVEVDHNVVAWNADGISVISQRRSDAPSSVQAVSVHDNVIASEDFGSGSQDYALAWLEDWDGSLFSAAAGNTGRDNRFWIAGGGSDRSPAFAWDGDIADLAAFSATPGGKASQLIDESTKDRLLAAAGVPTQP
jgi:nitrous oxidase accessory protein NosD